MFPRHPAVGKRGGRKLERGPFNLAVGARIRDQGGRALMAGLSWDGFHWPAIFHGTASRAMAGHRGAAANGATDGRRPASRHRG